MIDLLVPEVQSYLDFYSVLSRRLLEDLKAAYPNHSIDTPMSIPEAMEKTRDKFIFVLDEWDGVFEMRFMTEKDKEDYILFLKDKKYVRFAYMTGILPISKYFSGSPFNMFEEFSAFQDDVLSPYFGLTRDEILSAMVVYGFLTYHEGQLRIPNHELMLKFKEALASEPLSINYSERTKKHSCLTELIGDT